MATLESDICCDSTNQQPAVLLDDLPGIKVRADIITAAKAQGCNRIWMLKYGVYCSLEGSLITRRGEPAASGEQVRDAADRRTNGGQSRRHGLEQSPRGALRAGIHHKDIRSRQIGPRIALLTYQDDRVPVGIAAKHLLAGATFLPITDDDECGPCLGTRLHCQKSRQ